MKKFFELQKSLAASSIRSAVERASSGFRAIEAKYWFKGLWTKGPLNEYKREAFILFEQMLQNLRTVITSVLSHLELKKKKIKMLIKK